MGRSKKRKSAAVEEAPADYMVDELMEKKVENGQTLYRAKWQGYSHDEDTWEPPSSFSEKIVAEFEASNRAKGVLGKDGVIYASVVTEDNDWLATTPANSIRFAAKSDKGVDLFWVDFDKKIDPKLISKDLMKKYYPNLVKEFYKKHLPVPDVEKK